MFIVMGDFRDFHKVENMHFDIPKLKKGLEEVLKIENYDNANYIQDTFDIDSSSSSFDTAPSYTDQWLSPLLTIGQLDDNALFYMRSRGIRKKEAKEVLTYAFASEAINNISIPEVKKMARKLIAKKLNVDLDFNF